MMKPVIDRAEFGEIVVDGKKYTHDIIIRLDGKVDRRKKHLSKALYGTSHLLSLAEAEFIYEEGAEWVLFGGGQFGKCRLSEDAKDYFKEKECAVKLLPIGPAVERWNQVDGKVIGVFHLTC
jgi:hypothetical protein